MFKFLRRIRKNLITDGETSKYLAYAAGEIVLVVIGILIALQINNWNQRQINNRNGKELLNRIQHDLVKDTLMFRSNIVRNDSIRQEIKEVLVEIYDGVETLEEVEKMSAVWDLALDQPFSPNDNTYQSILSSGTLGHIRNQGLQEQIVDLYSEYNQSRVLLVSVNDWMIGMISALDTETDFIKANKEIRDIYTTTEMLSENDFSYLNDRQDPRFKLTIRAFSGAAFYQNVYNAYQEDLIQKCDTVLGLIHEELNTK
jgi:hypothetical protein